MRRVKIQDDIFYAVRFLERGPITRPEEVFTVILSVLPHSTDISWWQSEESQAKLEILRSVLGKGSFRQEDAQNDI